MDTQSSASTPETVPQSSGNPTYGGGPGATPSGGGSSPGIITAEDLAKQNANVTTLPLTLSDQIAANFAALSSLLGNPDQTGGGAYPVPVPVATSPPKSPWLWVIMIGAAFAVWFFFFHKKGNENG